MTGKLDPEERVMDELASKRKAAAIMKTVSNNLSNALADLGWDCYDSVVVEIAGSSTYEIEGAGTKWAPVKGTRKYNKDAFIVIKNIDRNPTISSKPNTKVK